MKRKWIKKGDKVIVIAGNDRGTIGEVTARKDDKVLIKGVNVRKRHVKSREQNRKSDILEIERPIHISNIALCDTNGKKLKLQVKLTSDEGKELVYFDQEKEKSYRKLKKLSSST